MTMQSAHTHTHTQLMGVGYFTAALYAYFLNTIIINDRKYYVK